MCVLVYSDQLATKETDSTLCICMQFWFHFHYDDNSLHFTQILVVLAHQSLVAVQLAAHSLVVVQLAARSLVVVPLKIIISYRQVHECLICHVLLWAHGRMAQKQDGGSM